MSNDWSNTNADPSPEASWEEAPVPACPFATEPQPSIAHLMIWAACVAVYMSAYYTLVISRDRETFEGVTVVIHGLAAMVNGAYLAAIPLTISRWMRNLPFPRSGGEALWLLGTLGVLQLLSYQLLFGALGVGYVEYQFLRVAIGLFVWSPVYVYAFHICRGYWRAYFVFKVATVIVWYMLERFWYAFSSPTALFTGLLVQALIITSVLCLVAGLDALLARSRYRWPHWAGLILALLNNAVAMLWYVWYITQGPGR